MREGRASLCVCCEYVCTACVAVRFFFLLFCVRLRGLSHLPPLFSLCVLQAKADGEAAAAKKAEEEKAAKAKVRKRGR